MTVAQKSLQPIRLCVRLNTITSEKYVFPTRSLHKYLWSLIYRSALKDIFRSISVKIWTNVSLGEAQWTWCFSPCYGCKIIISCQNGVKRLQGFFAVQRMANCTYQLPSQPMCSHFYYGWRYQARHYCVYANGLSCLFHLRKPPFILQLNLIKLQECIAANSMQALIH